jgi:hypothetical protein
MDQARGQSQARRRHGQHSTISELQDFTISSAPDTRRALAMMMQF